MDSKCWKPSVRASNVPVIMLTAKGEEDDRVRGLELGADDYITKPFSPREMVSRVKAVIRRTEGAGGSMHDIIEVDDRLKIDFDRREVWLEGKLVKLRPTEYRLLYHLVQNAGWVVTHDQLLVKVWGYEYRGRAALRAPVYQLPAPETREGSCQPEIHPHRTRRRLPLRGLQETKRRSK